MSWKVISFVLFQDCLTEEEITLRSSISLMEFENELFDNCDIEDQEL
jgi:hypothetical protein